MTVYLHAGLEKTGSSAIQSACNDGRELLAQSDLNYWDISARHNWALSRMVGRRDDEEDKKKRGKRSLTGEEVAVHLRAAIDAPGDLAISSEGVAHFSRANLKALAAVIGDAKIIVFIREPRAWFTSKVQQRMKRGATYEEALARINQFARETVTLLRDRFTEVRLRLYRPQTLLTDFMLALDRPAALGAGLSVKQVNASLPAAAIEAIGRYVADRGHAPSARAARELAGIGGPPFRLNETDLAQLLARHSDDIAWASKELGVDLRALSPPSGKESPEEATVLEALRRLEQEPRRRR